MSRLEEIQLAYLEYAEAAEIGTGEDVERRKAALMANAHEYIGELLDEVVRLAGEKEVLQAENAAVRTVLAVALPLMEYNANFDDDRQHANDLKDCIDAVRAALGREAAHESATRA